MKKRIFALFVIACMLVMLLPVSVLAEEPEVISLTQADVDSLQVQGTENEKYKSLDCDAYPAGSTIRLTEDILLPEGVTLSLNKSVNGSLILDMNGHTLQGALRLGNGICVTGSGVVTGETSGISGAHIESGTFLGTVGINDTGFFLTGGVFAGGLHVGRGNPQTREHLPTIYGGTFYGTIEGAQTAKGRIYGGMFYGDILDKIVSGGAQGPVVTYMDGETVHARQVVLNQPIEEISGVDEGDVDKMSESAKEALNANVGRAVMPADPSRPGYRLTGWYTADGEAWDFNNTVDQSMTLYAGWEEMTAADRLLPVLLPALEEGMHAAIPFTDVSASDWFYSDVKYVYENGLMTGTAADQFSPDAPVTRGMVMTILARREGVRTDRYTPWYAAGCEWAKANGVSDGTNPETAVTREQLAAMLYRYAKLKGRDLTSGTLDAFSDGASASAYAREALQWAAAQNLLTGSNGALAPQGIATRAQFAAILHRFFG